MLTSQFIQLVVPGALVGRGILEKLELKYVFQLVNKKAIYSKILNRQLLFSSD